MCAPATPTRLDSSLVAFSGFFSFCMSTSGDRRARRGLISARSAHPPGRHVRPRWQGLRGCPNPAHRHAIHCGLSGSPTTPGYPKQAGAACLQGPPHTLHPHQTRPCAQIACQLRQSAASAKPGGRTGDQGRVLVEHGLQLRAVRGNWHGVGNARICWRQRKRQQRGDGDSPAAATCKSATLRAGAAGAPAGASLHSAAPVANAAPKQACQQQSAAAGDKRRRVVSSAAPLHRPALSLPAACVRESAVSSARQPPHLSRAA